MKPFSQKTLGLGLLGLGIWGSVLARVFTHFDPASQAVTSWNSDASIAVLQANDPVFDTFRLYYYGQDRIGAWPWLAAQAWRALTGFEWTPHRLFLWQATWACGACFALWGLHRQAGRVLAATFAALALLSPLFHVQLFALSQPFGWQLTALLLAWWALTRLVEALARPTPGRASWAWAGGATLFATLACWTSPTSGPLLLACVTVQGVRVGALSPPGRTRWRPALAVLPLVAGILFEGKVRSLYHRFAKRHFGHDYRTSLQLDLGHLEENTRAILGRLAEHALAPLVFLGWALGLLALGFLLSHLVRRTLAAHAATAELAALTLAFAGAGLGNALITLLVLHVRLNGHDLRYLLPTFALGVLAAATGLLFLLEQVPAVRARWALVCTVLAGGLVAGGHLLLKPRVEEPTLALAQRATDALVARAPGTVLLGGYWDSYLLGALDPQHRLPTVVLEGDYLRTPFWVPRVREADEVLVSFFQERQAGTAEHPHPWLLQYGAPFQLAQARWAVHPPFQFALYRGVREHTQPVRLEPPRGFSPCEPGATLTVHFDQPFERGLLLLGTGAPAEHLQVEAPGAAEARLEGLTGLWLLHLVPGPSPLRQVTLRVRSGASGASCGLSGPVLVTGAPLAPPSP